MHHAAIDHVMRIQQAVGVTSPAKCMETKVSKELDIVMLAGSRMYSTRQVQRVCRSMAEAEGGDWRHLFSRTTMKAQLGDMVHIKKPMDESKDASAMHTVKSRSTTWRT